jgi:glycosyltransferase involved in cell wall biosynthesis
MRIFHITAGAAGMYCGSCIRDNALAAEMIRQGHQVLLLPLYTPTLTDEENVSLHRVFFGGISVYLEQYSPLFRRMPRWVTRALDSPRLINLLTRFSVSNNPRLLGEMTVSMLRGEDGYQNREFTALVDWLRTQPRPDVVTLHDSMLIRLAEPIRRALGCAIICTLQGEDIFLQNLLEPYRSQSLELIRANGDAADAYIAVSDYYADYMSEFLTLPRHKVHTVPLGINLQGYGPAAPRPRNARHDFRVGYFARVTPEKGLHTLCEAYRLLRHGNRLPASRLEAAGYLAPEHHEYLRGVEQRMREWGLGAEFQYHGVLSREGKIRFLMGLDALSVPCAYAEPKGLYMLEAMACGTPIVQPRHGSITEVVERSGGGLLFEPGNAEALADALHSLWQNPDVAAELGGKGAEAVRRDYSVEQEARRSLEIYARVLGRKATQGAVAAPRPA